MAGMAEGFQRDLSGRALLDALGGRLRMVDVTAEGCDPARIGDDLAEELARACHQRYLTEFGGIGGGAAMVGWEELPEDYRTANRDQAADVGRKLAAIGCLLNPRSAGEPEFAFRSDEVELLAQLEHERWTAERIRSGWTYGSQRDDAAKRHPCVAPWDALTDQYREKDRQAVLAIPVMLADVGLVIVRVEPPGTAVRLPENHEPPFGPETDDFRAAAIDRATNAGIMPAVRLRARPH
jgi:hypothetical protein